MTIARTVLIFVVAAAAELSGAYAIWRWRKLGAAVAFVPAGVALLFAYAVVQSLQPQGFGRIYAAYAGVFLVGAVLWGWGVDGMRPDRFDLIGGAIVLLGAATILWGRELFG